MPDQSVATKILTARPRLAVVGRAVPDLHLPAAGAEDGRIEQIATNNQRVAVDQEAGKTTEARLVKGEGAPKEEEADRRNPAHVPTEGTVARVAYRGMPANL